MAWYNKLQKLWQGSREPAAKARESQPYDYSPYLLDLGGMYARQAHVHLAVDMFSQAAACGEREIWFGERQITDHPLLDLLKNPNPQVDEFQFAEATCSDWQVFGNSFWWMVGDSSGQPVELWRLRADRVKIIPKTGLYVYILDSVRVPFHPLEIMHLSAYSATDDFFGDSRLLGAQLEISTDYAMAVYQNKFFGKNVAIPAGMWLLPEGLSNEKYLEAKAEITEMYSGDRRTAVVRGSIDGQETKFVEAGLRQDDMSFIDGRRFNRQVIYETMGIPTGMLSEASTEAHARVSERKFQDAIYYYQRRLAAAVNKSVMPFYGTGQEFRFKDVRLVDKDVLNSGSKNQIESRGVGDGNQSNEQVQPAGVGEQSNRGLSGGVHWPSSAGFLQPVFHAGDGLRSNGNGTKPPH